MLKPSILISRLIRKFGKPKLITTKNNYKMFIWKEKDRFSTGLSLKGIYEEKETLLIKEIVKEGNIVIDVGAHVGYHTLLFASLVGQRGKVYAIEPDPDNFSLLQKNIKLNNYNNVVPINMAVGSKEEDAILYKSKDFSTDHRTHYLKGRLPIKIKIATLDNLFKNIGKIDLIKIDIQGTEYDALLGAKETLKKCDHIVTEYQPKSLLERGINPESYFDLLKDCGFKLKIIQDYNSFQNVFCYR